MQEKTWRQIPSPTRCHLTRPRIAWSRMCRRNLLSWRPSTRRGLTSMRTSTVMTQSRISWSTRRYSNSPPRSRRWTDSTRRTIMRSWTTECTTKKTKRSKKNRAHFGHRAPLLSGTFDPPWTMKACRKKSKKDKNRRTNQNGRRSSA